MKNNRIGPDIRIVAYRYIPEKLRTASDKDIVAYRRVTLRMLRMSASAKCHAVINGAVVADY